ncbi:prepilin peptidase [Planctomycetales bacterium ZRK34]|nr:prepilin peptidase [Planctomycetales bacterium ZRK34]
MSVYPVRKIEIGKWGFMPRLRHSPLGRWYLRNRARAMANVLLGEAEKLKSLGDHELLTRAQAIYTTPVGDGSKVAFDCSNFPLIIEAIRRELGFTLHPNQVMAAIAMRHGSMIELATGEGKTAAVTLVAASYALNKMPVHVMTANAYLAERDAEQAGRIVNRLGLTAGFLDPKADPTQRGQLYRKSMVFSTLAELAFDWLRDRLRITRDQLMPVMPRLRVALIDEADQVMIDEARTPLILSERVPGQTDREMVFRWAAQMTAPMIREQDFEITAPGAVRLTKQGRRQVTRDLTPQQAAIAELAVIATLRARLFHRRDVHYIVQEDEIVIIDEKTGRPMPGRRWADGLYEAITLREGLELDGPTKHVAQITVQQFLWQYERLCGCSGTMATAAREVWCVYGRPTLAIPTHRRCLRKGKPTMFYTTSTEQHQAVAELIDELRKQDRAVLVGTTHITTSLRLSRLLEERGIEHHVLNAFAEKEEAEIIARAGQIGAVTIATNMAGRGTDIKLAPRVVETGGLHVISLQRHDSKRVDRQLIGRCARQGDPGSYEFILSLQDPLLKRHAPEQRVKYRPSKRRFGEPIHGLLLPMLWRSVQKEVEDNHREARLSMIRRQHDLEEMLGKPDYL